MNFSNIRCENVIVGLILGISAGLVSCGGGGGGGTAAPPPVVKTAPVISALTYSPTGAYVKTGGLVTVTGTLSVAGANSGVVTVRISVTDAAGNAVASNTTPVVGGGALTNGTLQGTIQASTDVAGTYTIAVSLTDNAGLVSNILTGSFRISPNPWATKSPMPSPRINFSAAASGGLAYVIGGELVGTGVTPGPESALVHIYDPATDSWRAGPALPTARKAPTAATVNGTIYVIGGYNLLQPGGMGTVEAYDPALGTWSAKAPMPTGRSAAASAVVNGKICVFGGTSAGQDLTVVECYDPVTNTWNSGAPMPTFRRDLGADSAGPAFLAIGGYSGGNLSGGGPGVVATAERYDPALNNWTEIAPMSTLREAMAVATAASGLLYAFGGDNALNRTLATVEAFDPALAAWKAKTDRQYRGCHLRF
jgi:N-acetylneuraminic acid mutarotase